MRGVLVPSSSRYVSGLEFMVASTSVRKVCSSSKLKKALPSIFFGQVFTDRTIHSQIPPHQAACSTINFPWILFSANKSFNCFDLTRAFHNLLKSSDALLNILALSEYNVLYSPLLEKNLRNANRKHSVDKSVTNSKCKALVTAHVNIAI